jgi:hypothetical protein
MIELFLRSPIRISIPENRLSWLTFSVHPCGGGVEYLHRDPASRKKRRNETKKGGAIA